MANARKELEQELKKTSKVMCAKIKITHGGGFAGRQSRDIILKLNYTESDYKRFLIELDFEYDDGFGGQELFGMVWIEDGTWLERGEYDGSEWWEHKKPPDIPAELL